MSLLIVTGLSGAGKSLAVNALEDIGYFCIDNIPPSLLSKFVDFSLQGENSLQQVAMVIDIRGGKSYESMRAAIDQLRDREIDYKILFLDARSEVLERRYKETRRRHPISLQSNCPIDEAICEERKILAPLYEKADYIIDTSILSTSQLKDRVVSLFVKGSQGSMALNILSFGFKYGLPKEADIVFDVRCLPNPFYIADLKEKTGLDHEVSDYVLQFEEARALLEKQKDLIGYSLPLYVKEGKSQLTIAVGCTGGKHRSVTFAEKIADFTRTLGFIPLIHHRDLNRTY
ncbi:MAG: RNase adapter RapZ [Oscillospiraceae bacterium]|nr:RNase adapter RapZ [Oscillospiraceae bacterium]